MMSKFNSESPAYPVPSDLLDRCGQVDFSPFGLTKREYFASMAMQGLMACPGKFKTEQIVKFSIETADALLIELEKPTPYDNSHR